MDGPATRPLPRLFSHAAAVALAVAVVVAPPLVYARDLASDEVMFGKLDANAESWACHAYLRQGGRHSDEVQTDLLPAALYHEAAARGSVTALRDFLREHPDSPYTDDARRGIEQLYDDALTAFQREASTEDPRTVPFMTRLLEWQRQHDTPTLQVRFLPPSSATLALADRVFADSDDPEIDKPVAPIAPHFTDGLNQGREETIARLLQEGFARVFPNDVLHIENGPRLSEQEAEAEITEPRIQVAYAVIPSGQIYEEEGGDRLFVGIRVLFDVTMRVPGDADGLDFTLEVEPPERFSVSSFSSVWMDQLAGASSDGQVYSVMALRAFDQLSHRLQAVFFKDVIVAEPTPDPLRDIRDQLDSLLGDEEI